MTSRVIHTGQALVDVVLEVGGLPVRGGNVNAHSSQRYAGGAVSILLAAARTGARAVHAGAHGSGPNGDLVRRALTAEGVHLADPPVPGEDTGICVVLVEPTAERTFITTYGAERRISVDSLARSGPAPGDVVCVTGYSLYPPTREPLLEWLEGLPEGVQVVLDPGAALAEMPGEDRARMLALTQVWTSNALEAKELTGVGDVAAAAGAVAGHLPEGAVVVVRDGADGCVLHVEGATTTVPGFPQVPVDTNGAGDAHTGVLCAERTLGTDWVTAARRANAAGAIKVTRRGPATAPTRAEVDAFLASPDRDEDRPGGSPGRGTVPGHAEPPVVHDL
ncbi:PfkB family carbohydrate kinase [Ornithinimicrobium sp. CNJ-824]|uniref:PfkB family carbohydrate kinase n=1 Tax=Ornithinimicrobium sp. CNJ-824 TaxID=1904966 RepID=UPI000AA7AD0B|nr:PfkB family carbohydrate kinase [Ornithinimicrobium sp. CNJ-824]